jgi:hypothetical protein
MIFAGWNKRNASLIVKTCNAAAAEMRAQGKEGRMMQTKSS